MQCEMARPGWLAVAQLWEGPSSCDKMEVIGIFKEQSVEEANWVLGKRVRL